ncbi:MAG TPA: hypothetical protein VNR64_09815 [Vicinamibacterales bacterium]|nr:hypothetical protein [Vicinamibacterales bacterium]
MSAWCPRETDLWSAITAGRWPDATNTDLWAHVNACPTCRDIAVVSSSLCTEGSAARREAAPPSAAVVWWRAQMRAKQEAALAAERPITIVQGLAAAAALGLGIALAGTALPWLQTPLGWLATLREAAGLSAADIAAVDLTSRWIVLPLALIVISLICAPIAVYVITFDD